MKNKESFNYFESYKKQICYAQEMILNIVSVSQKGEFGSRDLMVSLHTVENDADEVNHTIQEHLLTDFVVPMDRNGMGNLAHALDDFCDAVEQIAIDSYIRKIEYSVDEASRNLSALFGYLEKGSASLCSAVELLEGYGKNRLEIKQFCVEAQSFESEADKVYIESVRALYEDESLKDSVRRVRHDLFDTVEDAMDAIEAVAEKIEALIAESV